MMSLPQQFEAGDVFETTQGLAACFERVSSVPADSLSACWYPAIEQDFANFRRSLPPSRVRFTPSQYPRAIEFARDAAVPRHGDKADWKLYHRVKQYYWDEQGGALYRRPCRKSQYYTRYVQDEEHFRTIAFYHEGSNHFSRDKVEQRLYRSYAGITRKEINWVLARCRTCILAAYNKSTNAPIPIVSTEVMERVQIDLIDMASFRSVHKKYMWILHIKDHYSKFSVLFALRRKTADAVARKLTYFFRICGPVRIVQCDNGGEFMGACYCLLRNYGIKVLHSKPRSPNEQGLVERSNAVVENMIRKWQEDNPEGEWEHALTEICWSINNNGSAALKGIRPTQLMFKYPFRNTEEFRILGSTRRQTAVLESLEDPEGVVTVRRAFPYGTHGVIPLTPQEREDLALFDGNTSSSSDEDEESRDAGRRQDLPGINSAANFITLKLYSPHSTLR